MNKISLSSAAFEHLLQHLVTMEEGKNELIEQLFPKPSKERLQFRKMIELYLQKIATLVNNTTKSEDSKNEIPFVIIGSDVTIQDLTDQEILSYRIVTPFQNDLRKGNISFVSPVGKALLFKEVGDTAEVQAPGGVFRYKIQSILLRPELTEN